MGAVRVEADKRRFAEVYEASLLKLEQLTPHQRSVLAEARLAAHVLLEAPAGGGKTFVAMARMLEVLMRGNGEGGDVADGSGCVLFACWSPPLCYFVTRWVCQRVPEPRARERVLRRLFLLFAPMDDGPRAISLDASATRIVCSRCHVAPPTFELVVVDEAHHVYSRACRRHAAATLPRALHRALCY